MEVSANLTEEDEHCGYLFSGLAQVEDGKITGWAICPRKPSETVTVQISIDGIFLMSVPCNLPDKALINAGFPGQGGGFKFSIPREFHNDESHVLTINLPDGMPVTFQFDGQLQSFFRFCFESIVQIEGYVDGLVGSGIKGWVVQHHGNLTSLTGRVSLQVSCDGVPVQQIVADAVRQDVAQVKRCTPEVGFNFQIPAEYRTGRAFSFSFKSVDDGIELDNSPVSISFPSSDGISKLYALKDVVDNLCASAWSAQRQISQMLPSGGHITSGYDTWARKYASDMKKRLNALPLIQTPGPLISIVIPTFRPHLRDFMEAIASVSRQTYSNWELIIVDDASGSKALKACIRDAVEKDDRISFIQHKRNRGISAATNTAIRHAVGEYVILFDHDDVLADFAVEVMVRAALTSGAWVLYSDEDKVDLIGEYSEPNFKPNWNYRLLLCQNYICHLLMIERSLFKKVGYLRSRCDGAQDHDLLLRLSSICPEDTIHHVPELLYHWRKSASSTASSGEAKPYAVQAGIRAIHEHLQRKGSKNTTVSSVGSRTIYSVDWNFEIEPAVCIIIPFRDQLAITRQCVENLLLHTEYSNWKIVLVDNASEEHQTRAFCDEVKVHPRISLMRIVEKFNFSRLNNLAVKKHPSEFYLFLNNDVIVNQKDWLRRLVDEALADSSVGIVGAKLVYPNQTIQHAGVILGVGGIADHAFRGLSIEDPGYVARAWCAQRYSAVTGACMLCRAETFREVGGFDEFDLAVAYNDVDLCLKASSSGWQIIWTPAVTIEHHESISRGDDMAPTKVARFFTENRIMLQRWGKILKDDPFYSPFFSRMQGIFTDLDDYR